MAYGSKEIYHCKNLPKASEDIFTDAREIIMENDGSKPKKRFKHCINTFRNCLIVLMGI